MGYRSLRVINEDRVKPGTGFGTHGHRDMEIITWILAGRLEHKDSMGNGSIIVPGDLQRMSAGKGVQHSEFNPSHDEPVHLLQIWIEPDVRGIPPGYEQKRFAADDQRGRLRILASPDGRDGSVTIHQDACVYAALLDGAESARHELAPSRGAYVHVARGRVGVNGRPLGAGDAAIIEREPAVTLDGAHDAEVLLFDLS
jgi:redox-sensitive bicupin YhaK (pirin superfamily)